MTSTQLNEAIPLILEDLQAIDIVCIDMRERSALADFYLIAGANSTPHLKAMADELRMRLKRDGVNCHVADADAESGWIVLDYLDVVVHLMLTEQRLHYALEELWSVTEPILTRTRRQADHSGTASSPPPASEAPSQSTDPTPSEPSNH